MDDFEQRRRPEEVTPGLEDTCEDDQSTIGTRKKVAPGQRQWFKLTVTVVSGLALAWLTAKTVFAGSIDLVAEPPPIVVVRAPELNIRQLPNGESPRLAVSRAGDALYLRCRDGVPMALGPWIGVIAGGETVGWAHSRFVSDASGRCPKPPRSSPRFTLRAASASTDGPVRVRLGPSTETLVLARHLSDRKLWTDGRHVDVGGERWLPVLLESGVSGWMRSDLINATGVFSPREMSTPRSRELSISNSVEMVDATVSVSDGSLGVSVGGTFRPRGRTAELQRVVAEQLSRGAAAALLAQAPHPTRIVTTPDGAIRVEVSLYEAAFASPESFLQSNSEELMQSLLIGDGQLARNVEEIYGFEAALVVRAAFFVTGVPEELGDVAYIAMQDPDVQAQMAVLRSRGVELARVLSAATEPRGLEMIRLRLAAQDVSDAISRGASYTGGDLEKHARLAFERAGSRLASESGRSLGNRILTGLVDLKTSVARTGPRGESGPSVTRQVRTASDDLYRRVADLTGDAGQRLPSLLDGEAAVARTREWVSSNAARRSELQRSTQASLQDYRRQADAALGQSRRELQNAAERGRQTARRTQQAVRQTQQSVQRGASDAARRTREALGRIRLPGSSGRKCCE